MIRPFPKGNEKLCNKIKMLDIKDTGVEETLYEIPLDITQQTYFSYIIDTFSSIYNYLIHYFS